MDKDRAQPTLNPMDGCPFCKWVTDRGETRLDEPCKLHDAISDLQQSLSMERELTKAQNKDMAKLKEKLSTLHADLDDLVSEVSDY